MSTKAKYLEFLATTGTSLKQWNPASSEFALGRLAAVRSIEILRGTLHAVLGGDVVKIVDGKLSHAADWYVERTGGETASAYAERSQDHATRYVTDFPSPDDWEPLFVLVVKDTPTAS